MTTTPSPERQRGCRECGAPRFHNLGCLYAHTPRSHFTPVLDSERADSDRQPPAEGRHEFKGHESADFCVYPVSELDFCDEPCSAPIHEPSVGEGERIPLCPVHQRLDDKGVLEMQIGGLGCLGCTLAERVELLDLLAPFAPSNKSEDSVTVLRKLADFYQTHCGDGRVVVSYPAPRNPKEQS